MARWKPGICHECWPDGWPYKAETASCVHGNWQRKAPPKASPTKAQEPAPEE